MKKRKGEIDTGALLCAIIVVFLIWAGITLLTGCSTRTALYVTPNGTQVEYQVVNFLRDDTLGGASFNPTTGAFEVNQWNTATSPIVADIIRAIYEAGFLAGTAQ